MLSVSWNQSLLYLNNFLFLFSSDSRFSQWSDDAERYVPSAPVILVGLKADLRPSFPTLKLAHLNEPNATSIGQVSFPLLFPPWRNR